MLKLVIFSLLVGNLVQIAQPHGCNYCRMVEESVVQLIEDSDTKNFGGGNTEFESKKMGEYRTSEIRLMELMERMYEFPDLSVGVGNTVLQDLEDDIETWWTKVFRKNPIANVTELRELLKLCIPKFCCPPNHWGPDCSPCDPCFAQGGTCSGNGTRIGNGTCTCFDEYKGDDCTECELKVAYRNHTTETCHLCDLSCLGCTGPTNADCKKCEVGYELKDGICEDIDECALETTSCTKGTYCENEKGTFKCKACEHHCGECSGKTEDTTCTSCVQGYQLNKDSICEDIDECKPETDPCKKPNEICLNMPGSYYCNCFPGFKRSGEDCVADPSFHDEL